MRLPLRLGCTVSYASLKLTNVNNCIPGSVRCATEQRRSQSDGTYQRRFRIIDRTRMIGQILHIQQPLQSTCSDQARGAEQCETSSTVRLSSAVTASPSCTTLDTQPGHGVHTYTHIVYSSILRNEPIGHGSVDSPICQPRKA